MKTPDVLLEMSNEEFDLIHAYWSQEGTKVDLRDALYATRQENGGISLEEVALTVSKVFDPEEVKALINELQRHED